VVLIAASGVVAVARSYTAIGQWAAAAPQTTLTRLDTRVVEPMKNDLAVDNRMEKIKITSLCR
jgi:hypothetical protein